MRAVILLVGQLEQDPGGRLRMHESNSPSASASPWNLVDQTISRRAARLDGRVQVGDAVTDVMDTGAPLGQEPSNRGVSREWSQQLHLRLAERKRHNGGSVGNLGRVRFQSQDLAVEAECRWEISNGNSHVGNARAVSQRLLRSMTVVGPQRRSTNSDRLLQAHKQTGE
jgi:hypothetical protein